MTGNVLTVLSIVIFICYNQSICNDINESYHNFNKRDGNGELAQNS